MLEDRPEYIAAMAEGVPEMVQRAPFEPLAIVNPRLRALSHDGMRFYEGCLSVPHYQARLAAHGGSPGVHGRHHVWLGWAGLPRCQAGTTHRWHGRAGPERAGWPQGWQPAHLFRATPALPAGWASLLHATHRHTSAQVGGRGIGTAPQAHAAKPDAVTVPKHGGDCAPPPPPTPPPLPPHTHTHTGVQALVERYTSVEVEGLTVDGRPLKLQANGWQARILQHEVDHLRGTLYVRRAALL